MSVKVDGLTKVYGSQKAVDNLSFIAEKGKITGFLGPNGAGKSTTMKIATGYLSATSGTVLVNDLDISKDAPIIKSSLGYLPENNPLYLGMYVKEFLGFIARSYRLPRRIIDRRISEIINKCGLESEKHKKIQMLSKGYRQRVGLAKALLPDPNVLILDEPTTGLDPNQIIEIRNLIKEVSKDKTVILSTHIMQEVEAICDRVVIINKGVLVADDDVSNLTSFQTGERKYRITFETKVDESQISSWSGAKSYEKIDDLNFDMELIEGYDRRDILKFAASNDLPLVSANKELQSLEDVFHHLTTENDGKL